LLKQDFSVDKTTRISYIEPPSLSFIHAIVKSTSAGIGSSELVIREVTAV